MALPLSSRAAPTGRLAQINLDIWLAESRVFGATPGEALDLFDALPPVTTSEMPGAWRGSASVLAGRCS
jgi:hypothetical protein